MLKVLGVSTVLLRRIISIRGLAASALVALLCLVSGVQAQTPAQRLLLLSGSAKPGLLDLVPGASPAYSLHKLRRAYAGNAINIRRASDNAQKDIGFVAGGNLNVAAVNAFCVATTCFVTTWYDQSLTSSINATQATAANQPTLVVSGSQPYISFPNDGSTTTIYFTFTAPAIAQPFTAVFNYKLTGSTARNDRMFGSGNGSVLAASGFTTGKFTVNAGSTLTSAAAYSNVWVAAQGVYNGASGIIRTNGAEVTGTVGAGTINAAAAGLGNQSSASAAVAFIGNMDTVVFFGTGLTPAQRLLVEQWLQANANT